VHALHDQLASLRTHAQLTRCFSAVTELLVYDYYSLKYYRDTDIDILLSSIVISCVTAFCLLVH